MSMGEDLSKIKGTFSKSIIHKKEDNKAKESQIESPKEVTSAEYNENTGEQINFQEAPGNDVFNLEKKYKKDDKEEQEKKKVYVNNEASNKNSNKNINDPKKWPENKKNCFEKSPENNKDEQKNNIYDFKEAPEKNKVVDFNYSLLEPLFQNKDAKKVNIILLTTGSYNPIHRMHIEILNIAYKHLLNLNKYNIICGFISPSADCYVIHKQPPLIPYNLRCEMIEKAIEEYNNENKDNNNLEIFIHKWEGTHDDFIDFPDVTKEIENQLNDYFKGIKIKLLYVCGMDLFLKCYYSLTKNVIAIDRKPYKNKKFKTIKKNLVFIIEDDKNEPFEPFSSTDIRKAYKNHDLETIKTITFPKVAEMIFEFYHENFK